jgi:hypothetical protein
MILQAKEDLFDVEGKLGVASRPHQFGKQRRQPLAVCVIEAFAIAGAGVDQAGVQRRQALGQVGLGCPPWA